MIVVVMPGIPAERIERFTRNGLLVESSSEVARRSSWIRSSW